MKKVEKEKIQHYSIRKLSVGAASVLIGLSFMGAHQSTEVKADTVQNSSITQNDKSNVIQQSEDKLDKQMSNNKSEVELSLKDTNEISTQETNNLKLDRKYVRGGRQRH